MDYISVKGGINLTNIDYDYSHGATGIICYKLKNETNLDINHKSSLLTINPTIIMIDDVDKINTIRIR